MMTRRAPADALRQETIVMLKSLFRELLGTGNPRLDAAPSLQAFRDKCRVLAIFEGSPDDRPAVQDDLLRHENEALMKRDIAVLRIAGGGVFQLFDEPYDLSADDIREDLDGPSQDEFEVVLVGRDGTIKLRSQQPMSCAALFAAMDNLPRTVPW
jgi:hypothetical protein